MPRIALLSLTAFSLVLIGCAGSPVRVASMSPDELADVPPYNLCAAYDYNRDANVRAELESRDLISEREWELIDQDHIAQGMSEVALICSWGRPRDINASVGSWGRHVQWVFRGCGQCDSQYVYTEEGRVTSWQN